MKNLKEFKALILRYESITLEEIEKINLENANLFDANVIATSLTGFATKNCTLCISARQSQYIYENRSVCYECVYYTLNKDLLACVKGNNLETYNSVLIARSPEQLLKAFKARAKHMRKLLSNAKIN